MSAKHRERILPSWLQGFLDYTDGISSPELYRKWAGIYTVGAALERRVWTITMGAPTYANLYMLLIGPPASGKSIVIKEVRKLLTETKLIKLAADSVSKASLVDDVSDAKRECFISGKEMLLFNSLQVVSEEFGNFMTHPDHTFMNALNHLYDNPDTYKETRRSLAEPVEIRSPQLSILAGTQPRYLGTLFPDMAFDIGFPSRLFMVYQSKVEKQSLFARNQNVAKNRESLVRDLEAICHLKGCMAMTPGAEEALDEFYLRLCEINAPKHDKLKGYAERRPRTLIKLSMIMCAERGDTMKITEEDVHRAQELMYEAEELMPEIFKSISLTSDQSAMEEAYDHVFKVAMKRGDGLVPEPTLNEYLNKLVDVRKIPYMIQCMINANMLQKGSKVQTRLAGGIRDSGFMYYRVVPREGHGTVLKEAKD